MSAIMTENDTELELERLIEELKGEVFNVTEGYERLEESYSIMAMQLLQMEDAGWDLASGLLQNKGFSVVEMQALAEKLEENTVANPLLGRGIELRNSYMFDKNPMFEGRISERILRLIDHPVNQAVLFSPEARYINGRARYTAGTAFFVFDKTTNLFARIPLSQIGGWITDPDNPDYIQYIQRSYTRQYNDPSTGELIETPVKVWIPSDMHNPPRGGYPKTLAGIKVDANLRIIESRATRSGEFFLGIPDALSAMPWAILYSAYMKSGARVLEALASIVWQVRAKTQKGMNNAAAQMRNANSETVKSAVTAGNTELASLPRAGAVDLGTGRPLAAMVASALGVSVVALLADPGTSGAYGTAQTLDTPTIKVMQQGQNVEGTLERRALALLGANNVVVNWQKIETEPVHRIQQSLALAFTTGGITQEEYREATVEALDIKKLSDALPEPNEFTGAKAYKHVNDEIEQDNEAESSAIPSQGNSGDVGSMVDGENAARNDG